MIANAVMEFVGNVYQGESEGSRMNTAADVAAMNSRQALQVSNAREENMRRVNAARLGEIRASAAQSGFDPSSGSLAGLQVQSGKEMELDALTQRYEGIMQSIGFKNEEAQLRAGAKNARTTGYLNAFGSLMKNGANYFGQPRVGGPAPVETRTPKPSPYYNG
jgi:hypothetical protein